MVSLSASLTENSVLTSMLAFLSTFWSEALTAGA